jgi:hypothetical protein
MGYFLGLNPSEKHLGYLGPSVVNSSGDYVDINNFDPFNPDIRVPVEWKAPAVRVRRRVPGSDLAGMEGITDTILPIYLQAKQLILDHYLLFISAGVGLLWLYFKDKKR